MTKFYGERRFNRDVIQDKVGDGYTFELIPGREKKILYAFILQRYANDDVDNLNDYPFSLRSYIIHIKNEILSGKRTTKTLLSISRWCEMNIIKRHRLCMHR